MIRWPKSFLGVFAVIAPLAAAGFAVPAVLIFGAMYGWEWAIPRYIVEGILFGLLFGLAFAFLLRAVVIAVPCGDRDAVVSQLQEVLDELGYELESRTDAVHVYSYSRSPLFRSQVSLDVGKDSLSIEGPMLSAMILKKRVLALQQR